MKSERNWGRLGMKSNWMTTTINDVCSLVTDGAHNSPKSVEKGRYMASVKDFTEFGFDFDETFNTSIVISPLVNVFAFNCIHHLLIICITILPH